MQFAFLGFQLLGVEAFGEAEFWLGECSDAWTRPRRGPSVERRSAAVEAAAEWTGWVEPASQPPLPLASGHLPAPLNAWSNPADVAALAKLLGLVAYFIFSIV